MNVFLTGGTGFIGSYVAMELAKHRHHVTILARNRNKIPALNKVEQIEIVPGDFSDFTLIGKLLEGQDACILVALKYRGQSGREVLLDDTLPTVAISDLAVKAGVEQLIYTSSTAVHDSFYTGTGGSVQGNRVTVADKPYPATFYGATKAASENYLIAQSFQSSMRVNIIRPGYTFGNPVVTGGGSRFHNIVSSALLGRDIEVDKNDGTQFIWAGDLARLYTAVLHSAVNRKVYFGLSSHFTTWQAVAEETVRRVGSNSQIHVKNPNRKDEGLIWDVSDMKSDFGLEFDSWYKIVEHIVYLKSITGVEDY